jgi:hypothetical protein
MQIRAACWCRSYGSEYAKLQQTPPDEERQKDRRMSLGVRENNTV